MEELFNLEYKNEIEELKDEPNFEQLGDERYIEHSDDVVRLMWAFYRPSGSHPRQIEDKNELVSIMAFNHSRLNALERFKRIHPNVIKDEDLRVKIKNRTRMLFRSLTDDDFVELNLVLDLVPCYYELSVDQLINGRKWNETDANLLEATKYLNRLPLELKTEEFYEALFNKIGNISEYDDEEIKEYIDFINENIESIDKLILEDIYKKIMKWIKNEELHILQEKAYIKKISKFIE